MIHMYCMVLINEKVNKENVRKASALYKSAFYPSHRLSVTGARATDTHSHHSFVHTAFEKTRES